MHELVFLEMIQRVVPEDEARVKFSENRRLAGPFLSDERREGFVVEAVQRGFGEVVKFTDGIYARLAP